jgi:hypothetical protein
MKYHFWVWTFKKVEDGSLCPLRRIKFIKSKKKAWRFIEELYYISDDDEIILGLEHIVEPKNQFLVFYQFPFRKGNAPKVAFKMLDYSHKIEPRLLYEDIF